MVYSARKLSLVKEMQDEKLTLRIAFASNDQVHVNQHFGTSMMFALYDLTESHWELVELVEYGSPKKGHDEQKLKYRIEALKGCQAMYCNAVGSSAIRQLLANNIQPLKIDPGQEISLILMDINQTLHALLSGDEHEKKQAGEQDRVMSAAMKRDPASQWINKSVLAHQQSANKENRLTQLLDEDWS